VGVPSPSLLKVYSEGGRLDLETSCREAQHPYQDSPEALGQGALHILVPGHRWNQLSLKPALKLLEIAQGQGLHLHGGGIVVFPGFPGSKWHVEGELEGSSGLEQGVDLDLGLCLLRSLDTISPGQGIEENGSTPFVLPFLTIEKAVLPEPNANPDAQGESGADRLHQGRIGKQIHDFHCRLSGSLHDFEAERLNFLGTQMATRETQKGREQEKTKGDSHCSRVRSAG
jgi:hypothetical protein